MDELRRYELYIVFQPELDDAELETRIERVNGIVTAQNGDIVEVVRKGKRRLAYNIQRFNTGIDVIYQVNLPSRRLEFIERQFNLIDDVIRYLIVRDDHPGTTKETASKEEIVAEVAALRAQPVEEFGEAPPTDGDVVGNAASENGFPGAPTIAATTMTDAETTDVENTDADTADTENTDTERTDEEGSDQ